METYLRPQYSEQISKDREIQNRNTRNYDVLPAARVVGNFHRLLGCLPPHPNTHPVQDIPTLSRSRAILPIQSTNIWSVNSTHGIQGGGSELKLMALHNGIRIHQYLDDWLVRTRSHQTCLQHTQTLVALCQELGWTL